MNSSHLTTDITVLREHLHQLQQKAYNDLDISIPGVDAAFDRKWHTKYLETIPDITPSELAQALAEFDRHATLLPNVVDLSSSPSRSILNARVRDLETVVQAFDEEHRLARTCFGTVPGGGLDASSYKVEGTNGYAIVIPEGFFHLTNLLAKLVVLLHPLTPTAQGLVFLPSALSAQFDLMGHPYIKYRHQDLLEAFFLIGDPTAALPYHQAIPYQDRFAYLLVGTELFVLAHEVAHVLLGHLDVPLDKEGMERRELAADEMALRIVTSFFRTSTDSALACASLCGTFFLSMVRLWETGLERVTGSRQIAASYTHPVFTDRIERFSNAIDQRPHETTPGWYLFTHNAIRIATDLMAQDSLEVVAAKANSGDGLSARVLPRAHQHLGHLNGLSQGRCWLQIADLLISTKPFERRLGLWFLVDNLPHSAIGLYQGLLSEEEHTQAQFESALIAVEPLYANYIPRLRQLYRETAENDQFAAYIYRLAPYLGAKAAFELEEIVGKSGPMSPDFFALDDPNSDA